MIVNAAALIPGSFCSPELLAHILYSKYVQAVPLYRQEKDYAACGAKLSRQTMSNWIIWAAVNKANIVDGYAIFGLTNSIPSKQEPAPPSEQITFENEVVYNV